MKEKELKTTLTEAAAALCTIQGIELGFFESIPSTKPISAHELSGQLGYDIGKVDRWIRFAMAAGLVERLNGGYTLSHKGALLRHDSAAPELIGLHHMLTYFCKTVGRTKAAYADGVGFDALSLGLVTPDYISRVANHLSRPAATCFYDCGVSSGHTVLDLGCGDGSVLREIIKACPGSSATGIDMNANIIKVGHQINADRGLQDQIDLQVGNITNLKRYKDGAFDWVYAFNVFHFLPILKREKFIREMIRISRYGIFTNQIITNTISTVVTDVLLSTLFTDFIGFFSESEADELIAKNGSRHHRFLPIIQGESRLVVIYTLKNDVPLKRVPDISDKDVLALEMAGIVTAKDLLSASEDRLKLLPINTKLYRKPIIKILFP